MSAGRGWRPARRAALFEQIPCGIFVVDPDLTIVDHNRAFIEIFGESRGKPCHLVTLGLDAPCEGCSARETFADGRVRVLEQGGTDRDGHPVHHLMQYTPMLDDNHEVEFVAAIATDLTATKRLQREYQTLFEQVPCHVAVINRDLRVVKANEMFRRVFGEPTGQPCFEFYKHRRQSCEQCPTTLTFRDGKPHTSSEVGVTREGKKAYYVISTAPLRSADGEVSHVIQMSVDITGTHDLEEELQRANILRQALVEQAPYAIVVLDRSRRIVLFNAAAERLWETDRSGLLGQRLPPSAINLSLDRLFSFGGDTILHEDTTIATPNAEQVPVRVAAVRLPQGNRLMGAALIVQDLREIRQLEREKLEAERLAAVGQTVAGLAHGIKNILTGLEGGMYVTSTGLQKNDNKRVRQGWDMLERNIGRISTLVKSLLAFSRGDAGTPRMMHPGAVVAEVAALFRESAEQHGLTVRTEIEGDIAEAPMDSEGLHTCLANLVSNALDACLVSHNPACSITLRLREEHGTLIFEVSDTGCGMDYDVKQKVFTSFFSTKGAGGTGLGLLLTRKIAQQHGGSVTFESTPGSGTTFRLSFPRHRLPPPPATEEQP